MTVGLALYGRSSNPLQAFAYRAAQSSVSSHDRINRGNTRPSSVGTPVAAYPR